MADRRHPRYLAVGHLSRPHGNRGEIYVTPLTDHPEDTFVPGVVLHLGPGDTGLPDPDLPPLRVESARPFRRGWLVAFGGVGDREGAREVSGAYLLRAAEEVAPPGEDEFLYHELLGLEVRTAGGEVVGSVHEVYETAPADLLEVRGGVRSVMIPFLRSIVLSVDLDSGVIVVDPPDGLLDL